MKLSVVLNTKNSGQYLEKCLSSVQDIADEIVLVDMASTDDTLAIAKAFNARVFQYPDPEIGYADPAREFLFSKAKGEWLLMIDSDEELTPDLSQLIVQVVHQQSNDIPHADVYYLARSNIIFNHQFTHTGWFPDYQPRLWKKGMLTWQPTVHSEPIINGAVAYFPAEQNLSFIHHNYQTVAQFIDRTNKYTSFQAELKNGNDENFSGFDFYQSFFAQWWQRLMAQEGYQDGNHGVALSFLQASAELQVQAKKWQAQDFPHQELKAAELKKMFTHFCYQAKYWYADYMVKHSSGMVKLFWRLRRKFVV